MAVYFQDFSVSGGALGAIEGDKIVWSELVGGDLVISPPFKWQRIINASGYRVEPRIDEPVVPRIMETLLSIPESRSVWRRVRGSGPCARRRRRGRRPRRARPRPRSRRLLIRSDCTI